MAASLKRRIRAGGGFEGHHRPRRADTVRKKHRIDANIGPNVPDDVTRTDRVEQGVVEPFFVGFG
jgi:hypothetical protein